MALVTPCQVQRGCFACFRDNQADPSCLARRSTRSASSAVLVDSRASERADAHSCFCVNSLEAAQAAEKSCLILIIIAVTCCRHAAPRRHHTTVEDEEEKKNSTDLGRCSSAVGSAAADDGPSMHQSVRVSGRLFDDAHGCGRPNPTPPVLWGLEIHR